MSTIRKPVNFGEGLGNGELIINFENVRQPHFIVKLNGREVLDEPRGNAESSLAAYDFDGDGRKEVFYQNGDEFSLTVSGFKGRKLEELGSVTCNNGLIIADDGLCASRYGSQGLCDMFRIENGKMEISEDEDIDPLLFSSDDFRNLRYSFKDTSREDRQIRPVTSRDKRQKDIPTICAARQIPCRQAQEKQHLVFRAMPGATLATPCFFTIFAVSQRYRHDMNATEPLDRFIRAQDRFHTYETALKELRDGRKESHWMWFIFPQAKGPGKSRMSEYYGIGSVDEARRYLHDPILGGRLREATLAMLSHKDRSAESILGETDALKFRSSMTLFDIVSPGDIFADALQRFFGGSRCRYTEALTDCEA